MWTLLVWVQRRRRVLPYDQVNTYIRKKNLNTQLKHADEQIKPAISVTLTKQWPISHSLKFWSWSSQYSREAVLHAVTSWSSLWLSHVHTCLPHCGGGGSSWKEDPNMHMAVHAHTHTLILLGFCPQGTYRYWNYFSHHTGEKQSHGPTYQHH